MSILASLQPGQSLLVQETYDPAWQAWLGDKRLEVRPDPMGFMHIESPPGPVEIELRFVRPLENIVGIALAVLTLAALILLGWRKPRWIL